LHRAKIVHFLSVEPTWVQNKRTSNWEPVLVEIALEEALAQFTEKRVGRPPGGGGGLREVTVRR
jgi:hypothetical protein